MNERVKRLLRCPSCGGMIEPVPTDPETSHSGGFSCSGCAALFPVSGGVPRLLPSRVEQDHVATSFGFQWMARARGSFERETLYGLTAEQERAAFFDAFGIKSEDLKGKTLLDAGCGDGFLLELISGYGADIVGIDINTAISVAYRRCRHLPDVTVIQGNILRPCFAPAGFDLVWCEGVVVHTPDPVGAFRSVCRLVKPGGRLYLWVYPSDRLSIYQRIRDLLIAPYRIPRPLLFGLSYLLACGLFPVLRLSGRRRSLDTILFDLFDNLSPQYQWRFTEAEIRSWFKEAGYIDVKVNGRIGVSGRLPEG